MSEQKLAIRFKGGDLPEGVRPRTSTLTQAAREGALEGWLQVLRERHPDVTWVPKRGLDLDAERS